MARRARAIAATLCALSITLGSCSQNGFEIENEATDPAELARYFPEKTSFVQAVDVAEAREELDMPEDADATPLDKSAFRDEDSPQTKLYSLTSRAFPIVATAYATDFEATDASPLDGRLIRAAAGSTDYPLAIVSTSEPFVQVTDKLERTGYSRRRGLYVAGPKTPRVASRVVADGGGGRVVFTQSERLARKTLRRIAQKAEPGPAADALHAVSGSVKLALTGRVGKSRCVDVIAAAQSATGKGAIMALVVEGQKPDPDRFDPRKVRSLDFGTPSVLVDALLVPFNVAKPTGGATEPISELLSFSRTIVVEAGERLPGRRPLPSPADAYDCPREN